MRTTILVSKDTSTVTRKYCIVLSYTQYEYFFISSKRARSKWVEEVLWPLPGLPFSSCICFFYSHYCTSIPSMSFEWPASNLHCDEGCYFKFVSSSWTH